MALNVAQAAGTRLDHILVTLGNLYRIFNTASAANPDVVARVLASLELRWSKTDQPVFILAVFFNPYIRCRLFNPANPTFCANGLFTIVKRAFQRLFKIECDSGLFEAYISYYNWSDEFSKEAMHLDEYMAMYKNEVSLYLFSLLSFADIKLIICGLLS